MTEPRRCVLYARVSRGEGEQTPESQLGMLRELAERRGWEVIAEWSDHITGDPAKRRGDPPGLAAALCDLASSPGSALVIFAADRLVRSPLHLLEVLQRIQAEPYRAAVVSLQDGSDLDTTTDAGELFAFLRGWWARMELRLIRARTRAGLARARAEGTRLGRRPALSAAQVAEAGRLRSEGASWSAVSVAVGAKPSTVRGALAKDGGYEPAPVPVESDAP